VDVRKRKPGFSMTVRSFSFAHLMITSVVLLALTATTYSVSAFAAEGTWPGSRYDNARSGFTPEPLTAPLELQWQYAAAHAPRPAWPEPGRELHRMPFDYAYHVCVADGLVFFGSSADHKVYALDLATGRQVWTFFTEGPVRFAPAVAGEKLYVAADDGMLYCLEASTGRLVWEFRGGPRDERLIGNGQMISRWPARTGVAIEAGVAYFTAGMWARDGVYVYALDAGDGSIIWKNDTSGYHYIPIPHHEGMSGVAPQGQLLVLGRSLIVPTGRAAPAIFDCRTGKLLFYRTDWSKTHHPGSSWAIAGKGLVLFERRVRALDYHVRLGEADPEPGEGLLAIDARTGEGRFALTDKHRAVISGDNMYLTGGGSLVAVDLSEILKVAPDYINTGKVDPVLRELQEKAEDPEIARIRQENVRLSASTANPGHTSRVGLMATKQFEKWNSPVGRTYSLIQAGDKLVAGGREKVTVFDVATGRALWHSEVKGNAYDLAAAAGKLLVSTSAGSIYCFGAEAPAQAQLVVPRHRKPVTSQASRTKAKKILDESGITEGYCLMLGIGDGELAAELAMQSDLIIYCMEPDEEKAAEARSMLDLAGLYGVRVTVHHGPLSKLPYADYFANLVVLDDASKDPFRACSSDEMYRVLRPYGGVAGIMASRTSAADIAEWLRAGNVPAGEINTADDLVHVVRGALPGAGEWTHEYADAGRSAASRDALVKLPLEMLWFGGPGPDRMVTRHWRGPVPLFTNGRMFIPGENCVIAIDAYNGRELWSRELPGVGRYRIFRGGNIVADDEHVYALQGLECLQLDAETGRTARVFRAPFENGDVRKMHEELTPENAATTRFGGANTIEPSPIVWEYLAVTDRFVVGAIGAPNVTNGWWPEAHPELKYLFVFDKSTGRLQWEYEAEEALAPYAIAVSEGRVHLIDRTSSSALIRRKRRGAAQNTVSVLKALDLETGDLVWQKRDMNTDWSMLASSRGVLVANGGGVWQGAPRGMGAFSAADGSPLWTVEALVGPVFPVIVGDTLFAAAPYRGALAYDLQTGERVNSVNPLTGVEEPYDFKALMSCGIYSGSENLLLFRSGSSALYDLKGGSGVQWFPNTRPSCWINMIPAGGMVLQPEGSSGCSCPYNFQTSHAMVSAKTNESWSSYFTPYSARGAAGSGIKHLKLNFGAPGEQRDREGNLWMGYPRPYQPDILFLPVETGDSVDYYRFNADDVQIEQTSVPWLYASGAAGSLGLRVGLAFNPPAVACEVKSAPRIDGELNEDCWDGSFPARFVTDNQAVEPRAIAYMRSDEENLYLAFRRLASVRNDRPVPWTTGKNAPGKPLRQDDALGIRLFSFGNRGLVIYISASGETSILDLSRVRAKKTAGWNIAVKTEPSRWTVEAAIPWDVLSEYDVHKNRLMVYLENFNQTGIGPSEAHFQYRPWRGGAFFNHHHTIVVFQPPEPLGLRTYRLRLHFAEMENVDPGDRVFDVKVQGRTAIRNLDIVREAGGSRIALTKEVAGVTARDAITLELVPRRSADGLGMPPVICALSLDEEGAMTLPVARGSSK